MHETSPLSTYISLRARSVAEQRRYRSLADQVDDVKVHAPRWRTVHSRTGSCLRSSLVDDTWAVRRRLLQAAIGHCSDGCAGYVGRRRPHRPPRVDACAHISLSCVVSKTSLFVYHYYAFTVTKSPDASGRKALTDRRSKGSDNVFLSDRCFHWAHHRVDCAHHGVDGP